jgi:PadR family transcriptional regulator
MAHALGELETLVLLATIRLGEEAYGVSIREEIRRRTGKGLSRGAIYTAIARLERKGFLASVLGNPSPVRGGRAKRFFSVTRSGSRALHASTRAVDRMREGLDIAMTDG